MQHRCTPARLHVHRLCSERKNCTQTWMQTQTHRILRSTTSKWWVTAYANPWSLMRSQLCKAQTKNTIAANEPSPSNIHIMFNRFDFFAAPNTEVAIEKQSWDDEYVLLLSLLVQRCRCNIISSSQKRQSFAAADRAHEMCQENVRYMNSSTESFRASKQKKKKNIE